MAVPTHGPSCQTWIFKTKCWYCGDPVHVLQCTCESVVLLNQARPPWPKHDCGRGPGGIGGSGLSGWTAVSTLRSLGVAITPSVMERAFPKGPRTPVKGPSPVTIKRVPPSAGKSLPLLAVIREESAETRRSKAIEDLPTLGRKLLGLDARTPYTQVTLVVNRDNPNLSYTALAPEKVARRLRRDVMVMAVLEGRVAGDYAIWLLTDVNEL